MAGRKEFSKNLTIFPISRKPFPVSKTSKDGENRNNRQKTPSNVKGGKTNKGTAKSRPTEIRQNRKAQCSRIRSI